MQKYTCVFAEDFSTQRGGAGKAEHSHLPSPVAQCRGCAPRSCRLHTFSGTLISVAENEEEALKHQVTLSRMLPQGQERNPSIFPLCSLGTPDPGTRIQPPFLLPTAGAQVTVLFPPSQEGQQRSVYRLLDPLYQQGAACRRELTHQHLGYTVLLPNIAEVP